MSSTTRINVEAQADLVRERIRTLCRKTVAVRFDDDDKDDSEEKS